MGRDLKFKLLTLVFALTTLIALSACAVASAPTTTSESDTEESVETTDDAATDNTEPEPDEPADDSDSRTSDASDDADSESESNDSADHGDVAEEPAEQEQVEPEEPTEESPGNPTRLQIDSIDVDAEFEYVGVNDEGDMEVPQEWENVAWYEPGTVPGAQGNSVVAGHYDSYTDPAVFYDLGDLEEGDEVRITTEDGEELVFEVTEIELVHIDDADTSKIFGDTDERNLNLITCEGIWDTDSGMYDERLIVYTTLVDE